MGSELTVTVDYREVSGWHYFTSKEVPSLLVAHKDRILAYNDVATVLEQIFLLRDSQVCKFAPELSAEEFFGQIDQSSVVLRKAA